MFGLPLAIAFVGRGGRMGICDITAAEADQRVTQSRAKLFGQV